MAFTDEETVTGGDLSSSFSLWRIETDSTDFVHNESCLIRYQRVSIANFLLIFLTRVVLSFGDLLITIYSNYKIGILVMIE